MKKALDFIVRNRTFVATQVYWLDLEAAVKERKPLADVLNVKMRRFKRPERWIQPPPFPDIELARDTFYPAFVLYEKDIKFRREYGRVGRTWLSRTSGTVGPWSGRFPSHHLVLNDRHETIGVLTEMVRSVLIKHRGVVFELRSDRRSYDDGHSEAVEAGCNVYWHFATIPDLCSCKLCHPG